MSYNQLSDPEHKILIDKHTEPPFSGEYDDFFLPGVFICRQCNNPLFSSSAKFSAGCGWPAFDQFISNSVVTSLDADGYRTEISCRNCGGHLGHVFTGEKFTANNTRHCVNSASIRFIPNNQPLPPILSKD